MKIQKFGRYEVRRPLGKGGMGIVYLAVDPVLEREVAIKVLSDHLTDDRNILKRFLREAQTVAKLQHPCIVSVHDYGEQDGKQYIVMPYLSGGSLQNRLAKGTLDLAELALIVKRVAQALDKAHSKDIIHRDLKPGNILLDDQGLAYLSDFGVAKVLAATTSLGVTGIVGTPAYMSPEQAGGQPNLDGRSDIYSLGVIMFEALTGQRPFRAEIPTQLLLQQIKTQVPNIHEIKPNLPSSCQILIQQSLAKTPDRRYANAEDLARDLAAIARGEIVQSRPELRGESTEPIPVNELSQWREGDSGSVSKPKKVWRPQWFILMVLLVLLIVCGGVAAAFVAWQYRPRPTVETMLADVISATTTASPESEVVVVSLEPTPRDTSTAAHTTTPVLLPTPDPTRIMASPTKPVQTPTDHLNQESIPTEAPSSELVPTETSTLELTPTSDLKPALPVPPVVTGRLAIPLIFGNEPKVYIVNIENGELLGNLGAARQPDYSDDGTKLVVNGEGGGEDKLRVSDPIGSSSIQIGDKGLNGHSHPTWSPDGTQVIYDDITIDPTGWRIYFRDLSISNGPGTLLEASAGPIIGQTPLWASQDRFIFRGCNTWGNAAGDCGTWLMQGNMGTPIKLTSNSNHIPTDVRGDTVVYASAEAGNWNIYALNIVSGATWQLTFSEAAEALPAISPDGRTIAFLSNQEDGLAVWLVGINGGDPRKLFRIPPDWGQLKQDGWSEEKLSWGSNR